MKRVTLDNLKKATKQEVFDYVSTNLINQGKKSVDNGDNCKYRTYLKDGTYLKCAAGWLMTERQYRKKFDNMEQTDWDTLVDEELVPAYHRDLIIEMQVIHDKYPVGSWKKAFRTIAENYDLECNPAIKTK